MASNETVEDFFKNNTIAFRAYVIHKLTERYHAKGEEIPRYTITQDGKLVTESHELRLQYRSALDGALIAASYMDFVKSQHVNHNSGVSNE